MQGRHRAGCRVAAVAFAALLPCVFALPAQGEDVPEPDAADAALDQAITELVASPSGPPGVVCVVQRDDEIEVHRAGVPTFAPLGGVFEDAVWRRPRPVKGVPCVT